jgi:GYF domain 2
MDKQWYYKKRDARIGPVAEEELIKLFRSREIGRSTLVSSTQNDQSQPEWRLFWASGILSPEELTPPPLRPSFASDRYAWLIAIFPLLISMGDLIRIALMKGATYEPAIILVSLFCYGLLAWLDQNKLLELGYTDAEDRLSVWWALLIPVYLWKRANIVRQSKWQVWFWVAMAVLGAVVSGPVADEMAADAEPMHVEKEGSSLYVTSLIGELTISNVTVNHGQCKLYISNAAPIRMGEARQISVINLCNPIEATFESDHGTWTYNWSE